MKKIFKITGIFLFVMTILLAISTFILARYIDPNKFKGRVSQYVYAKTGQVLVINGNMQWSIFPWIGLKANGLTYYNAPTFTPKVFVCAKEMDIKIKLIPLITGKVEVGNITLNDAVVNLTKNIKGNFNWQTITKDKKEPNNNGIPTNTHNNTMPHLFITSLKIKNGKLNWYDQQKNSHTTINALNISSKRIQFGKLFPVSIQFNLLKNKEKNLSVNLNTEISLSNNSQQYLLKNIQLTGVYFRDDRKLNLKANGNLSVNSKNQTLSTLLKFEVNNIQGQIELNGNQLSKNPHLFGILSTDDFSLKQLLQDLGKPLDTKNSDALKTVSLLAKLDVTNSAMSIIQMHAKIDKTDLFGNVNILPQTKNLQFNVSGNQIAIDDYLSNKEESPKKDSGEQQITQKTAPSSLWAINGNVKINNLSADKLKLSDFVANLNMRNNVIRISPLHANLYKGQLVGNITIDKHQENKTTVSIKQSVTNLDIKELLHEFSDADKLNGSTNISADLVSTMDANTHFVPALNGKIKVTLTNGSLKGVDVIYQLSRAHSFIKHLPSPAISDSKQTAFSALTANAIVNNGVINTDDLALTSAYLKVNGKGSTNLITKEVHYRLNALAEPRLATENKGIGKEVTMYQVPIKVSGKVTKPSVNLDFVELAKTFYTKEIQKTITEHLAPSINIAKDKLKAQIQTKIKAIKILDKITNQTKDD